MTVCHLNRLNNIRCANETVLIGDTERKMQEFLYNPVKESEEKGLKINCKNTECLDVIKKNIQITNWR